MARPTLDATFAWLIATSETARPRRDRGITGRRLFDKRFIDGDGATEESIPICVTVRIRGSEIEVDFTG